MAEEKVLSLKKHFWFPNPDLHGDTKFDIVLPSSVDIKLSDADLLIGSIILLCLPLIVFAGKSFFGFGNLNFNYNKEDQPYYTTKEILEGAYNVYDRMQDINYYPDNNNKGYFSNTFNRIERAKDKFLFNLDFVSKKVSHFIKNANFLSFMKTNKENENNYSLGETNDYSTDEYNIHNEIHASSYDSHTKHSLDNEDYASYNEDDYVDRYDSFSGPITDYDNDKGLNTKRNSATTFTQVKPYRRFRIKS